MMRLSPRGKITYDLLSLMTLLLCCYGLGFMLESLYQLPANPLARWGMQAGIERFAAHSFQLLLLTGLLNIGCAPLLPIARLRWLFRGWRALVAFTLLTSPWLAENLADLALSLFLVAALLMSRSSPQPSIYARVCRLSLLLIALSAALIHIENATLADAFRLFRLHVAYGIGGVGLMLWLMRRFSRCDPAWLEDGCRIVAGLVFLAGSLISMAALRFPDAFVIVAAPVTLLCAIILASRNYRALSHRDENASLAPHWLALATLLWLSAFGFLGALSTHPDIFHALRATSLAWARDWLMGWALLALTLAAVNLLASELRGDNRRVTGYLPLWLIGFGVGLAGIASLCRGVAELYLRDLAGLEAAALREATLPLTLIWMICLLAVALGILIFALGFLARRPRILVRKRQTRPAENADAEQRV